MAAEATRGASAWLARAAAQVDLRSALAPRGIVLRTGDAVARISGLDGVAHQELVAFDCGALGLAYDLLEDSTGVLLLSGAERLHAGDAASGLDRLPDLPVGPATLGRVFDPLGRALDGGEPLPHEPRSPLFRPAPELIERKGVDQPLFTGVLAIDAAVPIGRGQRELIVGDRNVGKSALAIDFVAAQRPGDVACVYVAIGQPAARVLALRETLARAGRLANVAIVAADASAPPGMRFLAPYAGASVAEWFRDTGRDALVVYDDLTKHADAYRELSLLLDRPPGREAFPGDIFSVHAELLERAAARRPDAGGGSVTAIPIVETTEGDIAAYIPTNAISITDGQIYLDALRFARNQRPAVDVGRSVSRIGGAAQCEALRLATRDLRVQHARFEVLEALARVGLELDPTVEREIARGRILRELLRQARFAARSILEQVVALVALSEGWLDAGAPEQAAQAALALAARARVELAELAARIEAGKALDAAGIQALATLARRAGASSPRSAT